MLDSSSIRKFGGYIESYEIGLIKVTGDDRTRFLQAQTTNDINKMSNGQSIKACLLDRKAKIVSDFCVYKQEKHFFILVDRPKVDDVISHLEKFRFADKVEFQNLSNQYQFTLIEGPLSKLVVKESLDAVPNVQFLDSSVSENKIAKTNILFFKHSAFGEDGYILASSLDSAKNVLQKIKSVAQSKGFEPISSQLLEVARIEAGIVKFGIDYDSNSLLPETPLVESAVSYEKGCFQGQEVLARVRSHGAPSKALVGLTTNWDAEKKLVENAQIFLDEKEFGWLKSSCSSKFLDSNLIFALVKRDYREPGKTYQVKIENESVEVTVCLLPFYKAPSTVLKSQELYDQALQLYTNENQFEESIQLLEEAITLNPVFEDAYESLGVIYSKQDRLDKAIEIMEHLSKLNPDSIMAHTNLSVFYLDKGWKEKAEEEKAISTSIQMLNASRAAKEKEELAKQKEKDLEEVRNRLSMFEQVLEIDEEDFLANYGKGSCLVELEKAKEAIPFLCKALELKPNHTVAYLELARAYIDDGQVAKASNTLEKGKSVASRQGDLEPLKKMQLLESKVEANAL